MEGKEAKSINSDRKLAGKVVIITGGASSIGQETAHLFINQGARMVVIADTQDDLGNQVAASIGSEKCSYVHCDVTEEKQVKQLVEWTITNHGQLDIMFSNADMISSSDQTILNLDFSELDKTFALNMRGMAACVKHAARAMVAKNVKGSIVCMTSVAASHGKSKHTDYVMSKHAVLGLVRCASVQFGVYGIRVNCVSPTNDAVYNMEIRDFQLCAQNTPLKGVVLTMKNLANAVLFLASNDSEFVTGQDLVVDGGLTVSDYYYYWR